MIATFRHAALFAITFSQAAGQSSSPTITPVEEMQEGQEECLGFAAHPFTFFTLFAAMMVVPFYVLATFVQSKASTQSGLMLGWLWLLFGAGMACISLFDVDGQLGTLGNVLVPVAWLVPSFLLFLFRKQLVYSHALSQKWMVGLQLWRAIGGVFLIELPGGNLAPIFAYAAGIGDLVVAMDAAITLIWYRQADRISPFAVYLLIVLGVLDFISAFFFGFFSSDNEAQLFYHDAAYNPTTFPVGLIPFFLVPYAIFFHTLSFLTQREFGSIPDPIYGTVDEAIVQEVTMANDGRESECGNALNK
jgi:hypothetical protein